MNKPRAAKPLHPRAPSAGASKSSPSRGRRHLEANQQPTDIERGASGGETDYQIAANELRKSILDGVFAVGEKITHDKVRTRLNGSSISKVSLTRAFIDLEHEGLVTISPKVGTHVKLTNPDELAQLWRTRVVLEDFFVSTLARDTRSDLAEPIASARELNRELISLATNATQRDFDGTAAAHVMRLDVNFHDTLATAAGYPLLTKELRNVRNRLRLATGPVALTVDQVRQIASDHSRILEAIRPREASLVGDVVRARLAISSHLRNAADRQGITTLIKHKAAYGTDPIWDIPRDLSPPEEQCNAGLTVLRVLLELFVASELSKQQLAGRLLVPTELCTKMQILAESCAQRKNEPISPEVKSEFITHDIRFHASLAFLSGMMFADEAISHIWQRMYDAADRALDAEKMQAAVREHNKILTTLAFYSSNDDEPKGMEKILQVVESHLLNALSRASEAGNSSSNPPASNAVKNSLLLPSSALEFIRWFASQLADR